MSKRKIILFIAPSLDGFIAREDEGIDWLFTDQDYGYTPFYKSIDTVLMGRKTYELSRKLEAEPFKEKKRYVFTKNRKIKQDQYVQYIYDIVPFTKKLLKSKGKDLWLIGGGEIVSLFLNEHFIDEVILFIHPIILGKGIPLFKDIKKGIKLQLLNTKVFNSGLVKLHYAIKKR